MKVRYVCPQWGHEHSAAKEFFSKLLKEGFEGVEINLPHAVDEVTSFLKEIELARSANSEFVFIAQQIDSGKEDSVESYISAMEKRLLQLASYAPNFINSHSGKDYFSFDDNCKVIEAALNISKKMGVRILHETHRGRFSFHASSLIPYLKKFPELELVGDFSHFCVVSESMLQDQQEIIEQIIPYVAHVHARVGFEQAPQVNDPSAPEWENHLNLFMSWWRRIIDYRKSIGMSATTITPEFGPSPYMPLLPITKKPTTDQWAANIFMMNKLKYALK